MNEKDMKVYIAGPLFTEADRNQRGLEEKTLKEFFPRAEIFNPLTAVNVNKRVSEIKRDSTSKRITADDISRTIYKNDANFIRRANVFFFDVASEDSGTMQELGMAIERTQLNREILILVVNSDFRLDREAKGGDGGFKMNNFVVGSILVEPSAYGVYRSFEEALKNLKTKIK